MDAFDLEGENSFLCPCWCRSLYAVDAFDLEGENSFHSALTATTNDAVDAFDLEGENSSEGCGICLPDPMLWMPLIWKVRTARAS